MAVFADLSGFGEIFTTGKLLNHAFKKEEIRHPIKHRHHECRLEEKEGQLCMAAPHLRTTAQVWVRKLGSAHWDNKLDPKYDGVFMGQVYLSRWSEQRDDFMVTRWNCMNHEFKSDRVQAYFEMGAVRFFDFVQSVQSPNDVAGSEAWCRHCERIEARNKWK
ncbi:hypothetical protein D3C71_77550 [compost metagenome]